MAVVRSQKFVKSWRGFSSSNLSFCRPRNLAVGRFLKEIIIGLDSKGQRASGEEEDILLRGKAFPQALKKAIITCR